ncbi:hypothetical protein ACWCQL_32125 [Streptomyces sp. NPDC002073]
MSEAPGVVLAGMLDELGDSLIATVTDWAGKGLVAILLVLVVVTIATKMSMKAAIGTLLAMVIALGIYKSRDSLSGMVSDEIKNPASSSRQVVVVVDPPKPGAGGVL